MMSIPTAGIRDIEAYILSVNYLATRLLRNLWGLCSSCCVASVDCELVDRNTNCLQIGKRIQIGLEL